MLVDGHLCFRLLCQQPGPDGGRTNRVMLDSYKDGEGKERKYVSSSGTYVTSEFGSVETIKAVLRVIDAVKNRTIERT